MTASPFPAGAVARLHIVQGEPLVVLACPPVAPTLDALARPGEITVAVHIAAGETWPDRGSETLAAGALRQGGAVVMIFGSLGDAMACASRIAHDTQWADAPGGRA